MLAPFPILAELPRLIALLKEIELVSNITQRCSASAEAFRTCGGRPSLGTQGQIPGLEVFDLPVSFGCLDVSTVIDDGEKRIWVLSHRNDAFS